MSDDSPAEFQLTCLDFAADVAVFTIGAPDCGGPYELRIDLQDGAANIEEALAIAAEDAAANLRAWAEEAENLAAVARAGRLRQLSAGT